MKTNRFLLLIISVMIFSFCGNETKNTEKTKETEQTTVSESEIEHTSLEIVGENIWIRTIPETGKVIMKLNTGNECKIVEKGRCDTIKGNFDYWYKIRFENKEGWVFGSQTSIKKNIKAEENLDTTLLNTYYNIKKAIIAKNYTNINKYIDPKTGIYILTNPGVATIVSHTAKLDKEILNNEITYFNTDCSIIFDQIPIYDCESGWTKEGCFANTISGYSELSSLIKSNSKFLDIPLDKDFLRKAKNTEKQISYVIKQTKSPITLYFAFINDKCCLVAINFVTPCSA